MPEESDRPERYFRLFLRGAESQTPTLLDFSGFLYDFNLLYEVSRLATDPAYDGFRFSRYVLYRRGRPLADRDRLRVEKLSQQSPLDLVTLLVAVPTAVGALWGLVQIVERVANARLNRRKLRAEVEKLERENAQAQRLPGSPDTATQVARVDDAAAQMENRERFLDQLRQRGAIETYEQIGSRILRASIRITEFDFELTEGEPRRER